MIPLKYKITKNNMKISYLLPTIKPKQYAEKIIKDIQSLPSHDYEIILVSTDPSWATNPDVKFFLDDKKTGNTYATNLAYKKATGDIVVFQSDDHYFGPNFLN